MSAPRDGAASGVEPAVAPPPGNPRFPLFDGLRAIAALSVLVYHTAFYSRAHQESAIAPILSRLNIGVAIFFVISGFLLYRPFVSARLAGSSGPGVVAYTRRRVLRIVPAYWAALTVLALYPGLNGLWGDWAVYYGFGQVYATDTVLGGIGPAWTLCTEAAFYVALPFYAALAGRGFGSGPRAVRMELALLAVLAAGSIAIRTVTMGSTHSVVALTLPALFAWFAVGMALAVVSSAVAGGRLRAPAVPALAAWATAIALFLILAYVLGAPEGSVFLDEPNQREALFEFVMSALVAGLLVLPAVFGSGGVPRRLLATRVVAWLGLVSYGVFLWHEPIAKWLEGEGVLESLDFAPFAGLTVLTLAIVVPIAALSYYVLERPILRFKDGFPARRRQGPGAADRAQAPAG
jgi:peptidoglycan/LPS O-acetylase OafA/YrhL